jgi:hypothetical protein
VKKIESRVLGRDSRVLGGFHRTLVYLEELELGLDLAQLDVRSKDVGVFVIVLLMDKS